MARSGIRRQYRLDSRSVAEQLQSSLVVIRQADQEEARRAEEETRAQKATEDGAVMLRQANAARRASELLRSIPVIEFRKNIRELMKGVASFFVENGLDEDFRAISTQYQSLPRRKLVRAPRIPVWASFDYDETKELRVETFDTRSQLGGMVGTGYSVITGTAFDREGTEYKLSGCDSEMNLEKYLCRQFVAEKTEQLPIKAERNYDRIPFNCIENEDQLRDYYAGLSSRELWQTRRCEEFVLGATEDELAGHCSQVYEERRTAIEDYALYRVQKTHGA